MTTTKVVKKRYKSHASVGLWHVNTNQGAVVYKLFGNSRDQNRVETQPTFLW